MWARAYGPYLVVRAHVSLLDSRHGGTEARRGELESEGKRRKATESDGATERRRVRRDCHHDGGSSELTRCRHLADQPRHERARQNRTGARTTTLRRSVAPSLFPPSCLSLSQPFAIMARLPEPSDMTDSPIQIGKAAPKFTLTDTDGHRVSLAHHLARDLRVRGMCSEVTPRCPGSPPPAISS